CAHVAHHHAREAFVCSRGSLRFLYDDTATPEIYALSLHDALPILAYHGADASTAAGALVWVRQTSDGQISVVEWGHDGGAHSGTVAVRHQWQSWVDTLDELDDDESDY